MDLEHAVLSLLHVQEAVKVLWEQGVRERHFEDLEYRAIFEFSMDYWISSGMEKPPTPEVLVHEFPSFKPLVDVEETPLWLAGSLKKKYTRSLLGEALLEGGRALAEDPTQALEEVYNNAWAIKQHTTPRVARSDLSTNVQERVSRYVSIASRTEDIQGVTFGLDEVDQHINGILPGELVTLAAQTKTGKSWILVNAFIQLRRAGYTPYFASLELSVKEMELRADAVLTGFSHLGISRGRLTPDEALQYEGLLEEFAGLGPSFIEKPPIGERTPQYLCSRAREVGADVILIDQLSFMEPPRHSKAQEQHQRVSDTIFALKAEISEDESHMLPAVMAVQFNRESYTQKGGGGLHNIALSSSLEQTADFVFALRKDKDLELNRSALLEILASRRTETKTWLLEFDLKDRTRFSVRNEYDD